MDRAVALFRAAAARLAALKALHWQTADRACVECGQRVAVQDHPHRDRTTMTVDTTAAPGRLSPEQIAAYLGLDPRRIETQVVVAVAGRYGLDPLLKHVIGIRSGGEIRPYITRDGLLHVAHASGQLDGIELVDGPDEAGRRALARPGRRVPQRLEPPRHLPRPLPRAGWE